VLALKQLLPRYLLLAQQQLRELELKLGQLALVSQLELELELAQKLLLHH
jgi:hypothetical protein